MSFAVCRSSIALSHPHLKCRRVFQALINIAIEELCETANALIAPVRMGVARPTAPFAQVKTYIDAVQVGLVADVTAQSIILGGGKPAQVESFDSWKAEM